MFPLQVQKRTAKWCVVRMCLCVRLCVYLYERNAVSPPTPPHTQTHLTAKADLRKILSDFFLQIPLC